MIANVAYLVGGACVVTALIRYKRQPRTQAIVTPTVEPHAAGLAVIGAF